MSLCACYFCHPCSRVFSYNITNSNQQNTLEQEEQPTVSFGTMLPNSYIGDILKKKGLSVANGRGKKSLFKDTIKRHGGC